MTEIKIVKYRLTLNSPFRIAHGSYAYRENVFLKICKDGFTGYGEAPVVPYYGVGADAVADDLRQNITRDLVDNGVSGRMDPEDSSFNYMTSASAFYSAAMFIKSAAEQRNAAQVLGINESGKIPGTSYTIAYDDDVRNMIRQVRLGGFRRIKVKAGIPGDIERIAEIKKQIPDILIRVDANQGWSVDETPAKIEALHKIGVELIEEPFAGSPEDIEMVAADSPIPILLDESIKSIGQIREYQVKAPHLSGIVVKIAKTGGPAACLSLIREAADAGFQVMLSSMVESGLGIAAALPLAPLCTWLDLDAPLLLADTPFRGLEYIEEVPAVGSGGLYLSDEFESVLSNTPPLYPE